MVNPAAITQELLTAVDELWRTRLGDGSTGYEQIILIGHSIGGLLARKLYVCACGQNPQAPFEKEIDADEFREWAPLVERIILLAGMNRGWRVSYHLSFLNAILWSAGVFVGNFISLFSGRLPLIFMFRRGAAFISQLRIQWVFMRQSAQRKRAGSALTIQLLGSIDDFVAPEDNIDLATGGDFIYLDVPMSGHSNVIEMDGTRAGQARECVFTVALSGTIDQLRDQQTSPSDVGPESTQTDVTDVIFVVHGIRDTGYWTHKIARRIKAIAEKRTDGVQMIVATETSTYGYFPMLPFLLPSRRRAKVEWLMDRYTEALSLFPNASFSFVGHSNGTYLLAKALQEYPSVRFKHVVFAGSVVRKNYDWLPFINEHRLEAVLNYVASADWVVAFFPKALQDIRLEDVGSAGHTGFRYASDSQRIFQTKFVRGMHAAALNEENWDAIAHFVVFGTPIPPPGPIFTNTQTRWVVILGAAAPLVWILIVTILGAFATGIYWLEYHVFHVPQWIGTLVFVAFSWLILKALTKL
jgi:pimeloyl-ACP methyl ester carboxylesterase